MKISVAIPVFNEEDLLSELIHRVTTVLDSIPGGPHEIVFVNDASTDGTMEILREAASQDRRISVVEFSRNFGHQAAVTAALDHVTGDVVVMMDGDLQDTPETIPRLIERYRQGYDVVYARRTQRKENPLLKLCYFLFYRSIARLSAIDLPLDSGDFSLISKRVAKDMQRMREHHRYLRGLRTWVGYRQIGIDVERDERRAGESKYTFSKLFGLAFDGVFAFSVYPLRAATFLGFGSVAISSVYAMYALICKLFLDASPKGFTGLIVSLVFLFGVQFLFLGIIGEYVGRTYEETKNRPLYVIKELVCYDSPDRDPPNQDL